MSRLLRSLIVTGAVLALVGLTVGGSLPLHAQNAPAPKQAPAGPPPPPPIENLPQPVFRTGINFVRVDVIVTDKAGSPVNDLKQGDFEITEQNRPQKIETFKLISLDGGLMEAANTPPRQIRTDNDEETEAAGRVEPFHRAGDVIEQRILEARADIDLGRLEARGDALEARERTGGADDRIERL